MTSGIFFETNHSSSRMHDYEFYYIPANRRLLLENNTIADILFCNLENKIFRHSLIEWQIPVVY